MATKNPTKIAHCDENIAASPESSDSCNKEGHLYGKLSTTRTHNGNCFAADALSNFLVLKTIFSNLDNKDMETCCQVTKCWNYVADPLLVRHYDVMLWQYRESDQDDDNGEILCAAMITKLATYDEKQTKETKYSLEDATKHLQAAMEFQKIAINCHTTIMDGSESIATFLSKFGTFAEKLRVRDIFLSTKGLCEPLGRYFPNLQYLNLSANRISHDEAEYFDKRPLRNRLAQLKRIDLGPQGYFFKLDSVSLANLFQMAPNLEEIHDLHISLADSLVQTQKAGCVKSLKYPTDCDDDETDIRAAFEKLASLELKLESFSFESPDYSYEITEDPENHPFLVRILQSSRDSLRSLTLDECGPFDFNAIPPMNRLEHIKFFMHVDTGLTKFFSADVVLRALFPHVSVVNILVSLYDSPNLCASFFPENQFAPWGVQIEKLELFQVTVNIMQELSRPFHALKELEFHVGERCNELKCLLPIIGRCWPQLERLTIIVKCYLYIHEKEYINFEDYEESTFDSMLTGIPDNVLAQLKDPQSRQDLSKEEIEKFRTASTIRKLSKLKILRFDTIDGPRDLLNSFAEKLAAISSVSKEFGFQFLPELKIILRIIEDVQLGMEKSLASLVNYEVETKPRLKEI